MMSTQEYVAKTVYPRSDAFAQESKVMPKLYQGDEARVKSHLKLGICPDCGGHKFLKGPEGGCSVNIECAQCGSRFNIFPPVVFERIPRG